MFLRIFVLLSAIGLVWSQTGPSPEIAQRLHKSQALSLTQLHENQNCNDSSGNGGLDKFGWITMLCRMTKEMPSRGAWSRILRYHLPLAIEKATG